MKFRIILPSIYAILYINIGYCGAHREGDVCGVLVNLCDYSLE